MHDVDHLAGPRVESARHVPLHVLARRADDELLAPPHFRPDARVEVNVRLVDIEKTSSSASTC